MFSLQQLHKPKCSPSSGPTRNRGGAGLLELGCQTKGMAALGPGPPPGHGVAQEAGLVCSETGLIHLVVDETSRHQGAVICFHSNKSHRYDSSPPMHDFLKCISYDSTKRILFQTQRNFIF